MTAKNRTQPAPAINLLDKTPEATQYEAYVMLLLMVRDDMRASVRLYRRSHNDDAHKEAVTALMIHEAKVSRALALIK